MPSSFNENNQTNQIIPHDNDVLSGRSKASFNHPGNSYYRQLVALKKVCVFMCVFLFVDYVTFYEKFYSNKLM